MTYRRSPLTDDFDGAFDARATPRTSFAERINPSPARPAQLQDDVAPDDGSYRAFGFFPSGTVGEVCDVRRWIDGTDISEGIEFQYRFLMQVGYIGEEELRLFLPDCIILIEGRHLFDLRKKIARRAVTFIQQHNRRLWPEIGADAIYIERISILRPESNRPK